MVELLSSFRSSTILILIISLMGEAAVIKISSSRMTSPSDRLGCEVTRLIRIEVFSNGMDDEVPDEEIT